jgi:hypothetical protein
LALLYFTATNFKEDAIQLRMMKSSEDISQPTGKLFIQFHQLEEKKFPVSS